MLLINSESKSMSLIILRDSRDFMFNSEKPYYILLFSCFQCLSNRLYDSIVFRTNTTYNCE